MAILRPVPQKHSYGCGVSAMATIHGCSYAAALRNIMAAFPKFDPCKPRGLPRKELVQMLQGYRLRRGATPDFAFELGSIVLITVEKVTHYLVFDGKGWLDSLDNPLTKISAKSSHWDVQKTGGRIRRLPRNGVGDLYLAPS